MPRMKLTDYQISMRTGFVLDKPLEKLPDYYKPWGHLVSNLVERVEKKTLRDEIRRRLPKCLAIPLWELYEKHDLIPVVTYASLFLDNTRIVQAEPPFEPENLEAIVQLPGTAWHWFFALGVQIELDFGVAAQAMQDVLDGLDEDDWDKIIRSLDTMSEAVITMQKTETKVHEKLPAEEFFGKLNLFFSGYIDGALEDGIIFEGVKEEPVKMPHANAGQSPIFKTLDALLGIEHEKGRSEYTETVFKTLLPSHRKFIYDLRKRPNQLKDRVESSDDADLKAAYNRLVMAILAFRTYHVQIVTKYVITPINRLTPEEDMATVKPVKDSIITYIKGMRDDCKTATVT